MDAVMSYKELIEKHGYNQPAVFVAHKHYHFGKCSREEALILMVDALAVKCEVLFDLALKNASSAPLQPVVIASSSVKKDKL